MSNRNHPRSLTSDSFDSILQEFSSKRHSNSDDFVDTLNRLCAVILKERDQVKLLCKYSSVLLTLVDFLSRSELRTPSLNIIACACLYDEFVDAFIKQTGVQKLVSAIDNAWDHQQLNIALIALFRIFKRRIKYPKRHDAILAPLIPRIVDFLNTTSEIEFQLTVCRFCMVLQAYPVTRNAVVELNGLGILAKLLSSRHSELKMSAFRALMNLLDFAEHENWGKGKMRLLLELSFEHHFSRFAYFCLIEESMLRDITEFLVHSDIIPKLFMHVCKSGCLDLKRLILISVRHLMPRLSQLTWCQRELRDLFQYLKNILDCKVDQEFHGLVVRILHDLSICTYTYKYFEEFNFMTNLLDILKTYIDDSKCPCICSGEVKDACAIMPWLNNHLDKNQPNINGRYFPKSLPPLTGKRLRQMCSRFGTNSSARSSSEALEKSSKQAPFHCHTDLLDEVVKNPNLTADDDADELFLFKCLMAEYKTTSRELERASIDCYILDSILKFLAKRDTSDADQACFTHKIVCHYEVLVEYAFFNPSHSKTSLDIISILVSDEKTLLQLILNEFILKLESYHPKGFRMADIVPIMRLDECSGTHYASVMELMDVVQEALNTNEAISLFLQQRNCLEKEEKLLVLHAASVLVSDKTSLRTMLLDDEGLKFLIDCLSAQNPKTQKIAAVAINELYKYFTYSSPDFPTVTSDPTFKNPHSELPACSSHSLNKCDSDFSKEQEQVVDSVGRLECRYREAVHNVEFSTFEDFVGANREIICSRSEYFKSLLLGNFKENESDTIFLANTKKSSLTFIFHFLHGCTADSSCDYLSNLSISKKLNLLVACDYFLLSDLKAIVEKLLLDNLCFKNIPTIYKYSKTHNSPTLAVKVASEALSTLHHADYWSCFQELVSLDSEFSFLADVEHLMLQRLQD